MFCKQYKKKVDNFITVDDEARKLFLSSGLPEVMKKKLEEKKKYLPLEYLPSPKSNSVLYGFCSVPTDEETSTSYEFPAITHVQQKSKHFVWNLPEIDLGLKEVEEDVRVPNCQSLASLINTDTEAVSDLAEKMDFDFKDEIVVLKKLVRLIRFVSALVWSPFSHRFWYC